MAVGSLVDSQKGFFWGAQHGMDRTSWIDRDRKRLPSSPFVEFGIYHHYYYYYYYY